MVAAIVGAAGVAASLYGSSQQADSADKAQKGADQNAAAQLQLGKDNLDWQKQRYNEWSGMFMPMLGSIKDAAYANQQPNYAGVTGDVGHAFDSSYATNLRNMQRYGMKPTDGAMSAMGTEYGMGRAAALAGGMNSERNRVNHERLSNLESVFQLGNPMLAGASAGVNSAYGGLMGAYGGAADRGDRQAGMYGQAAGSMFNSALGGAANVWNTYQGNHGGDAPYIPSYTPPPIGGQGFEI